jgi:single-strand DNA-binding protein
MLIGNIGHDPEMRYMPSGEAVCNFSMATSEEWKDKNTGEKKEDTSWHRISMFGKLAEIGEKYLKKGMQVYIEGRLKYREYTDSAGVTKMSVEIKADTMKMLSSKSSQDSAAKVAPSKAAEQEIIEDDIPF